MHRRDFLKFCSAASLLPAVPVFAESPAQAPIGRTLVLIEFNGGNDGLNTVVPYADPHYASARPTIGIARDQVLQLDEHLGLHPALAPLMPLWQAKQLALIQAVGYAQPNRSHFRSIEIWDTGSDSDEILETGWLARALPGSSIVQGCTADAIVIGRNPLPVTGGAMHALVADDVDQFARRASQLDAIERQTRNPALAHLLAVRREVHGAAGALLTQSKNAPAPQAEFPKTPFGRSMEQAARLVLMDHATPVIKVALGSFDTHTGQRNRQDRLLAEFADGVAAFHTAMDKAGAWNRVMLMTYSEFGRRVAENASGGTDHGTAAPVFLMGGGIKGGIVGVAPSLAALDDGDLRLQHDYRRVYNTVLMRGWNLPQTPFDATRYPPLAIL